MTEDDRLAMLAVAYARLVRIAECLQRHDPLKNPPLREAAPFLPAPLHHEPSSHRRRVLLFNAARIAERMEVVEEARRLRSHAAELRLEMQQTRTRLAIARKSLNPAD